MNILIYKKNILTESQALFKKINIIYKIKIKFNLIYYILKDNV